MIRRVALWMLAAFPVIALVGTNLMSQAFYTHRSLGLADDTSSSFSEAPEISPLNVDARLRALHSEIAAQPHVIVSDTTNVVLAKLYGLYFEGDTMSFPSYDFWDFGSYDKDLPLSFLLNPQIAEEATRLSKARHAHLRPEHFVFASQGTVPRELSTGFTADQFEFDFPSPKTYLTTGARESVMNRFGATDRETFRLDPPSKVRNRLIFVDSTIGKSYVFGTEPEAFFQLEPDYFYDGRTMAGIGRYLLCRVENPTPTVRIVMSLSTSLKGDNSLLPPVTVIGQTRVSTSVTGRGSARIVSEPVAPRMIDGGAYVLIDMGVDGTPFKPRNYGFLFNLYHHEINLDYRKLTAFARDISAIDEETYRLLPELAAFHPRGPDLLKQGAIYSGFYEDGWISNSASVRLRSAGDADEVHLQGSVPLTNDQNFQTTFDVLVDGQMLATRAVGLGPFDIHVPIQPAGQDRVVEIKSSRTQTLPGGDGREVGAYIDRVAFDVSSDIAPVSSGISIGDGWYPIEKFGGETFRWFANDAQLEVSSAVDRTATLKLDVAGGPGLSGDGTLSVLNDASAIVFRTHLSDRRAITVPVSLHAGGNVFTLQISGGGKRIVTDPRILNARVFSVRQSG